jgi:AraC-like DNA-binding protein
MMRPFEAQILPPPAILSDYVECIRVAEYHGDEGFAINVSVNGLPGIVFQHHNGHSPIESITTPTHSRDSAPTLYLYGQITEPGVMRHKEGPYTLTQVLLKPHALHSLLGLNASAVTGCVVELNEFWPDDLNHQLMEAAHAQERVALITNFLVTKLKGTQARDRLIEESLRLIHGRVASMNAPTNGLVNEPVNVKWLCEQLSISERHFERRFRHSVGLSPQLYIRIKRFNEAVKLMKTKRFATLTDLAYALHFYDQSHFIRDIKAFSGVTPKAFSQRLDDVEPDQKVLAFV